MTTSCKHCCTRIENLGVHFGAKPVLEKINLHLNCKELLALIGPNGAGKTTLLRAIMGDIAFSGTVTFRVRTHPTRKPRIGYVPQKLNFDQDSPLSVLDLVAMAINTHSVWCGIGEKTQNQARELLEKVSARHLANSKIGELSGGELQRVLLAIAMVPVPDLLLLDEPIAAMDVQGLALFYEIVDALKKEYDISIIMATHDLAGAARYADRMVLLNRTIVADGIPADVLANKKLLETFQLSLWNISSFLKG